MSAALVPDVSPAAVTVTSTVALPGGEEGTVIMLDETTMNDEAAVAPNLTDEAPVKPDPVMVTGVPPAVPPLVGRTCATTGTVSLPSGIVPSWPPSEVGAGADSADASSRGGLVSLLAPPLHPSVHTKKQAMAAILGEWRLFSAFVMVVPRSSSA